MDITVHEVQQNGQFKRLNQSSSGDCGGTSVERAFKSALAGIVTERMLKDYSNKYQMTTSACSKILKQLNAAVIKQHPLIQFAY